MSASPRGLVFLFSLLWGEDSRLAFQEHWDVKWAKEQMREGNSMCLVSLWLEFIHAGSELSLQISHGAQSVSWPGDRQPWGRAEGRMEMLSLVAAQGLSLSTFYWLCVLGQAAAHSELQFLY